jgi:hypothetical protein
MVMYCLLPHPVSREEIMEAMILFITNIADIFMIWRPVNLLCKIRAANDIVNELAWIPKPNFHICHHPCWYWSIFRLWSSIANVE